MFNESYPTMTKPTVEISPPRSAMEDHVGAGKDKVKGDRKSETSKSTKDGTGKVKGGVSESTRGRK